MPERFMTVTQLADELNMTPRAIRFYEVKGLVTPARAGTTRVYTHRDRARLQLILRGKRLGFSLAEIKEYLDLYDQEPTQVSQIKMLKGKVEQRMKDLERQRADIDVALEELTDIRRQTEEALASLSNKSDAA